MNELRNLISDFQFAAKNNSDDVENILQRFLEVENGTIVLQKTVRLLGDKRLNEIEVNLIENYVVPFCEANKIDITKETLKKL